MVIWIASYPRSGNTFLRVLLNSVFGLNTASIYNDDFDIGADEETSRVVGHVVLPEDFSIEAARESDELYMIKTHDPDEYPEDPVIYIVRDGRNSLTSYANYILAFREEQSFTKTLSDLIEGKDRFGTWSDHLKSWDPKNRPRTLFVRFEELVKQPERFIKPIADFVGVQPVGDRIPTFEELQQINSQMFRQGKIEPTNEPFTDDQLVKFWIKNYEAMNHFGYTDTLPPINSDDWTGAIVGQLEHNQNQLEDLSATTNSMYELAPKVISDLVELVNYKSQEVLTEQSAANALKRDLEGLRQELEASKHKVAQLEEQLSREKTNHATTLAQLGEFESKCEELIDIEKEYVIAEGKRQWLRETLDEHIVELSISRRACIENQELIAELQSTISSLDSQLEVTSRECESLQYTEALLQHNEAHLQELLQLVENIKQHRAALHPHKKLAAYQALLEHRFPPANNPSKYD